MKASSETDETAEAEASARDGADGKSPEAFRTISEVADDLGMPQHVMRFWETRFSQIRPLKRGGGRRYYRPEDVDLLRGIKHLLYGEGYTIKGVQRILKSQGVKFVQGVGREPGARVILPDAPPEAAAAAAEIDPVDDVEAGPVVASSFAPPPAPAPVVASPRLSLRPAEPERPAADGEMPAEALRLFERLLSDLAEVKGLLLAAQAEPSA
jgi:DNA-binding transcriptional MerR regulator